MKAEDQQALIEWLKPQINELENISDEIPFGLDVDSEMQLNTMRVALTTLTAQPVKLPKGDSAPNALFGYTYVKLDEVIAAIRAAGYEVQE